MSNEKNKRAASTSTGAGARKPNTAAGRPRKNKNAGKGTRSQANKAKVSGVPKEAAKKAPGRASKKQTA